VYRFSRSLVSDGAALARKLAPSPGFSAPEFGPFVLLAVEPRGLLRDQSELGLLALAMTLLMTAGDLAAGIFRGKSGRHADKDSPGTLCRQRNSRVGDLQAEFSLPQ
jgi:hypothetical protein